MRIEEILDTLPTEFEVYTDLGEFTPGQRGDDPLVRQEHLPIHTVHAPFARRANLKRYLRSLARELGEFFVGAFQPIAGAV